LSWPAKKQISKSKSTVFQGLGTETAQYVYVRREILHAGKVLES